MTRSHNILLAGMPETGKTTYIAALWHLLSSRELNDAGLRLSNDPTNRTYLNAIRKSWLQGKAVPHTIASSEETIELELLDSVGRAIRLVLPDLSGESFRDLWTKRIWHPKLGEFCADIDALAVFVHAGSIRPPARVDQANVVLAGVSPHQQISAGDNAIAGAANGAAAETNLRDVTATPPFDAEKSPTATQLAFVLQVLLARAAKRPIPVAVVVSAWDLASSGQAPEAWLRQQLPLIDQMLRANEVEHPYCVFGLSALGGDITNDATREKLLAKQNSSDRVAVVQGSAVSRDVTLPLRWLIEVPR